MVPRTFLAFLQIIILKIGWYLTEFITLSIGADHFKCCVYSYLFVSSIHLHIEKMTSYVDILLNFMPTVAILAMGEPIYGHEGHHSWNEHLLYLSQSLKLHIVLTNHGIMAPSMPSTQNKFCLTMIAISGCLNVCSINYSSKLQCDNDNLQAGKLPL